MILKGLSFIIWILSTATVPSPPFPREKVVTVLSSYSDLNSAKDEELIFEIPSSAMKLSPSQHYEQGEALLMRGLPTDALPWLAKATELMPGDAFAHGNFAIALHQE